MTAMHLPRSDSDRPALPMTNVHKAALVTAKAAGVTVSNLMQRLTSGAPGPVDAHMIRGWGAQLATYGKALERAADELAAEDRLREAGGL